MLKELSLLMRLSLVFQAIVGRSRRLLDYLSPGRIRLGAILPGDAGAQLVGIDQMLVRALNRSYPARWYVEPELEEMCERDAKGLLGIYEAIFEARNGRQEASLLKLKRAVNEASVPIIRGKAEALLMNSLYHSYIVEGMSVVGPSFKQGATVCRSVAERVLLEYEAFSWKTGVTHVAQITLGVMDYYDDERMTALQHLQRAVEEYEVAKRIGFSNGTEDQGAAHLYLGHLARERNDLEEARGLYGRALAEVATPLKGLAGLCLGVAVLDAGGSPRRARSILKEALRFSRGMRGEIVGSLLLQLARAEVQLGRNSAAIEVLKGIESTCENEQIIVPARKMLEGLSETVKGVKI